MNKIVEALKKLDVTNDNHWTADGLPRLDTVKMLASDQSITRDQANAAAPGFCRENAATWAPAEQGQGGSTGTSESAAPAAPQAAQASAESSAAPASAEQPSKEPEQPAVEQSAPTAADEVQALEEALSAQSEKVEAVRQLRADIEAEFERERQKEDDLRARLEALRPVADSHANAIQDYLASQRKALEERAARIRAIQESGVDLKELQRGLLSPLDGAMSRKTGRGTQRASQG